MDKFKVREMNERNVLQIIINHEPISRSEVARMLNLNKVTTSDIFSAFEKSGIVIPDGHGESTKNGGRRPTMMRINPSYGCILSVDFGYNYIAFMLTTLTGEVIKYQKKETSSIAISERILIIKDWVLENEVQTVNGLLAISVAFHGVVKQQEVLFSPQLDLENIKFGEEIRRNFDIPVIIENEANLAAIFERDFNQTKTDNLVSISIHKGIGAGIIFGNDLYTGNNGEAGEIGHSLLLDKTGELVSFEKYLSTDQVIKKIGRKKDRLDITLSEVRNYFTNHDEDVIAVLNDFSYYLTLLIQNVTMMYDPDKIIINSELVEQIPSLLDLQPEIIDQTVWKNIPVELSKNVRYAVLLGGYANAMRHVLKLKDYKLQLDAR